MVIPILFREELKEYNFGPGHPFQGNRYEVFIQFLQKSLKKDDYQILKADQATDKDLLRICQKDYINFTREYYRAANLAVNFNGRFRRFYSEDNRPIGRSGKIEEAARLIVGQAKMAAELVQKGKFKKVVSIGGGLHHAKEDYGEGFCIYNDVAFCAKYLLEKYGLERILILDTDAHAGHGTSQYFYQDPKVLLIDLHQDPRTIYPGEGFASQIGEGEGKGYTINVPLPLYAGDDSYQLIFEKIVQPVTEEFRPQIIIRNGGSDPHFADSLTNLGLSIKGFKMIGEKVKNLAGICEGKVIDLIASGYNQKVLPSAWLALISGLADIKISLEEPETLPRLLKKDVSLEKTKEVVKEVKRCHRDYWKSFG